MSISGERTRLDALVALFRSEFGRQARVVYDLGSRDGDESASFAELIPSATVVAVECNPDTIDRVRARLQPIRNAIVLETAVSDFDGETIFQKIDPLRTRTTWADGNPGASSLYCATGNYPIEHYVQTPVRVPVARLDTLVRSGKIPAPDLLWIDLQGAELDALRGLGRYLENVHLMEVEMSFLEIYQGQPLARDVMRFLRQHGFSLYQVPWCGEFQCEGVFVNRRLLRVRSRVRAAYRSQLFTLGERLPGPGMPQSTGEALGRLRSQLAHEHPTAARLAKTCIRAAHWAAGGNPHHAGRSGVEPTGHPRARDGIVRIGRWPVKSPARRPLNIVTRWLTLPATHQWWRPGDSSADWLEPTRSARAVYLASLPPRDHDRPPTRSHPLVVLVPVGPNDAEIASLTIESVTRNLLDPVDSIVVCASRPVCDAVAQRSPRVTLIDEQTVLSESARLAAAACANASERQGWYIQQFLKLTLASRLAEGCFIIDADTVLVRPQRFQVMQGDVILAASEYHVAYFDMMARLLPDEFQRPLFSTTAHQMLMRRTWLLELRAAIETAHPEQSWLHSIASAVDSNELSGSSDYDLYGQWTLSEHRSEMAVRRLRNTPVRRGTVLPTLGELESTYGRQVDSVSFHHWLA